MPKTNLDCLFCKIAKGEIPADIIAENDYALAFKDINPQAPTHILVIPRRHIASVNDLKAENVQYISSVMLLAKELAASEGHTKNGYRWVINTGDDGGQTVLHVHLHLLGGRQMTWPPG